MYLGKEGIYARDMIDFLHLLTISITRKHRIFGKMYRETWNFM